MEKTLGRFGHHPDPAIDFCIEVDSLVGLKYEANIGMIPKEVFKERYDKAIDFRVGGDQSAIVAKQVLRRLENY